MSSRLSSSPSNIGNVLRFQNGPVRVTRPVSFTFSRNTAVVSSLSPSMEESNSTRPLSNFLTSIEVITTSLKAESVVIVAMVCLLEAY